MGWWARQLEESVEPGTVSKFFAALPLLHSADYCVQILPVILPTFRIGPDILANGIQFRFVSSNSFIIPSLPNQHTGPLPNLVDTAGY